MADRREQYLWNLFQRMDLDGSGSITVYELQKALINGDWSPFNIETVRMMVSMFDVGRLKPLIKNRASKSTNQIDLLFFSFLP